MYQFWCFYYFLPYVLENLLGNYEFMCLHVNIYAVATYFLEFLLFAVYSESIVLLYSKGVLCYLKEIAYFRWVSDNSSHRRWGILLFGCLLLSWNCLGCKWTFLAIARRTTIKLLFIWYWLGSWSHVLYLLLRPM